jgi:acetyltransferase-like isoleucine patch superfamily enzyme
MEAHGVVHSFLVGSYEAVMRLVFWLPRYRACNRLKASFLRLQRAQIGKRVIFYPGVWICPGRNLILGDDVDLAFGVLITTAGGVTIGDRTLIGYRTQILSANHVIPPDRARIIDAGHESKPVIIGKDVWIGANCIVLPGVEIGEGAVVGAGSVVTRGVDPFCIVAGVPAKVIRRRGEGSSMKSGPSRLERTAGARHASESAIRSKGQSS